MEKNKLSSDRVSAGTSLNACYLNEVHKAIGDISTDATDQGRFQDFPLWAPMSDVGAFRRKCIRKRKKWVPLVGSAHQGRPWIRQC